MLLLSTSFFTDSVHSTSAQGSRILEIDVTDNDCNCTDLLKIPRVVTRAFVWVVKKGCFE